MSSRPTNVSWTPHWIIEKWELHHDHPHQLPFPESSSDVGARQGGTESGSGSGLSCLPVCSLYTQWLVMRTLLYYSSVINCDLRYTEPRDSWFLVDIAGEKKCKSTVLPYRPIPPTPHHTCHQYLHKTANHNQPKHSFESGQVWRAELSFN